MNDRLPDWTALREEFPTLAHWTYLDVARKTVLPRCQERALQDYVRDVYQEAGAGAWGATQVGETRAALAQLLGAKPAEIAFTKNTTEGLNLAALAAAAPIPPQDSTLAFPHRGIATSTPRVRNFVLPVASMRLWTPSRMSRSPAPMAI